jgi:hypothetical protein
MDKLKAQVEKAKTSGYDKSNDVTYYYPARDASGNGSATIRFLPGKTEDDLAFVKTLSHGFKGPTGKWFIEECPRTIGQPCYACEQSQALLAPYGGWKTSPKAVQDIVRDRGSKEKFIVNILVVRDEKNPENEGKIFLFQLGKMLSKQVFGMLAPEFADDEEKDEFVSKFGADSINPFDLKEGANFNLKIRKVEGQTNYGKSTFQKPSAIEADLSNLESLEQFTEESRFKSADKIRERYDLAVGNLDRTSSSKPVSKVDEDDEDVDVTVDAGKSYVAKPAKPTPAKPPVTNILSTDDADDDIKTLMESLAQ